MWQCCDIIWLRWALLQQQWLQWTKQKKTCSTESFQFSFVTACAFCPAILTVFMHLMQTFGLFYVWMHLRLQSCLLVGRNSQLRSMDNFISFLFDIFAPQTMENIFSLQFVMRKRNVCFCLDVYTFMHVCVPLFCTPRLTCFPQIFCCCSIWHPIFVSTSSRSTMWFSNRHGKQTEIALSRTSHLINGRTNIQFNFVN